MEKRPNFHKHSPFNFYFDITMFKIKIFCLPSPSGEGWGEALPQALLSLDKMIEGGIYDQVGGGFARYSTDTEWLAPHFEKMLYDNALLVSVLSEAYQLTKKQRYKEVIDETMEFVQRELLHQPLRAKKDFMLHWMPIAKERKENFMYGINRK